MTPGKKLSRQSSRTTLEMRGGDELVLPLRGSTVQCVRTIIWHDAGLCLRF